MKTILYPGSFDPVTNGHLDVIRRAARLFPHVTVAIGRNSEKSPLFSIEERADLLRKVCADLPNVAVATFDGLLVNALKKFDASAVIRGLRAVSDFEIEFQMALMNRELNAQCETLFLMPSPEYSFVSSSMIKDIAQYKGDISVFVPAIVAEAIHRKFYF